MTRRGARCGGALASSAAGSTEVRAVGPAAVRLPVSAEVGPERPEGWEEPPNHPHPTLQAAAVPAPLTEAEPFHGRPTWGRRRRKKPVSLSSVSFVVLTSGY